MSVVYMSDDADELECVNVGGRYTMSVANVAAKADQLVSVSGTERY